MLNTLETKQLKPELSKPLNKLVLLTFLLVIAYFGYEKYVFHKAEQTETTIQHHQYLPTLPQLK